MEYGLDLLKRCLCFARRNPENLFFSEDDCHPTLTLYSFTNNGWSLRLLEKTWQQLFLWVINLSSCVICLVIAREIFLLKSDCSAITKVHKLNFSLLRLTYFAKDKQTLKMEDTLYKMDVFRHRPICGLFPLKSQSLRQTFQRIIQALLLAKHLRRFCCWFEWS